MRRKGLGGDKRTKLFMLSTIRENMMGLLLPSFQSITSRMMYQNLEERKRRFGSLLQKTYITFAKGHYKKRLS
jgi:hypothetical protein